ncbi:ester hydrolase C11orf54 homolog isoform X2 [Bombus affinis]|uniref:Ester hydrolase C11orf54 homolog isoform X2 n=1 Tax=Bombus terrestris TaxID=30195 RepID=A0A9C6S9W2_BOMTE|nr:ester hydrolase C11orf54 homolog isoform X2 [Bombus terrestris]XP_050589575.1 ester hydrolase C11orf54 homolog isoform X2 [Bombus affinis]
MATLNPNELTIVKRDLHVPSLDEIKDVLKEGLIKNFADVEVEVVDCPDLTKEPFTLAAPGLGGNPTLLEIGGPAFLLPTVQKNKLYDIQQLLNHLQYKEDSFVVGAGAGPWPYLNSNCELIMNLTVSPSSVKNGTRISSVNTTNGNCVLQTLPNTETRLALLANLFVIGGKPGGTFLMKDGKVKQHVMADFSKTPLKTEAQLNNWLHFYNMSTPLIAVGTFVSSESDLDLRVQHFHSFSHHGEGGHYHIDTTPETIEYLGYFNLGTTLYRVDKPLTGIQFGKD